MSDKTIHEELANLKEKIFADGNVLFADSLDTLVTCVEKIATSTDEITDFVAKEDGVDQLISSGHYDPTSDINSKYYFKYN